MAKQNPSTKSEARSPLPPAPPPEPSATPVPPTYLLWSEAKALLMEQGGLRELEARRALRKVPTAKTEGCFKRWHRVRLLTYAQGIRTDADAVL